MVTTTNKGLAEPANGDLSWDVPLNANFEAIDKAFGSSVTISLTGLSTYAVSAAQAQNMSLNFSGTPSSNVAVTLPTSVGGQWVVRNGTTRGLTVSSLSGGAGTVTVPTGTIRSIYCDGTNVFFADSQSSGTDDEIAYTSDGVLTGSPDLTFDGAELSVGASASITSWTTGSGTFTAIFSANKLIPVGSSVTFSGVSTTPASPNGFNSTFEVTASTQASGASTVTITATGVGSSPVGGTISYGNLKIGGTSLPSLSSPSLNENRTAGVTTSAVDDGTKTTGTYTPSPLGGNMRTIINNGAFTLASPTTSGDYTMVIQITNGASAGAITFSGFTKVSGSVMTTTNTHKFFVYITKCNGLSLASVQALQ